MNLDLTGKHALVGGGSQGIGLASAQALAVLGATVTLAARTEADLLLAVQTLPRPHQQLHNHLVIDYGDTATLAQKIHALLAASGPVHILVNNAGGPPSGPLLDAKPDAFLAAYHLHLLAAHLITQAVVPGMQAAGYGRIVNIISTSVKIPLRNLGVSNTTRGAVASWAKTLATEVAPLGITVNNVLPGFTRTARLTGLAQATATRAGKTPADVEADWQREIPLGRVAEPHEVGDVVAFLCTPAAGYITGINVPVDGGRLGCL